MAKQVLTGVRLFAGGADLTAMSTKAELSAELEDKDVTTFASGGWREHMGGLAAAEIAAEGFWEAGSLAQVDDQTWALLGGLGPWTVGPVDANVGSLAYFMNAFEASYKFGGSVGDVAPYTSGAKSNWPLVRGQFGHPPSTPRTASGAGSSVQLGAVPAGKQLYAALHVLSVSGTTPSMTARVESDSATGFPSAVTVATFNAATGISSQILRVPGPITDDWFRFTWTISGTTPSFQFVGAFGIA